MRSVWPQCGGTAFTVPTTSIHFHFSSQGPSPESGNGGIRFNQGRVIVCVILADLTCHKNCVESLFFFKEQNKTSGYVISGNH